MSALTSVVSVKPDTPRCPQPVYLCMYCVGSSDKVGGKDWAGPGKGSGPSRDVLTGLHRCNKPLGVTHGVTGSRLLSFALPGASARTELLGCTALDSPLSPSPPPCALLLFICCVFSSNIVRYLLSLEPGRDGHCFYVRAPGSSFIFKLF